MKGVVVMSFPKTTTYILEGKYRTAGVKEYWIVNPISQTINVQLIINRKTPVN